MLTYLLPRIVASSLLAQEINYSPSPLHTNNPSTVHYSLTIDRDYDY
jgi:hypothetical protein